MPRKNSVFHFSYRAKEHQSQIHTLNLTIVLLRYYFELFFPQNSSTPVEDMCFASTFSGMQDVSIEQILQCGLKRKVSSINLNLISKLYLVLVSIFSYFVHIFWRIWHILWRISKRPNHRNAVSGRMNCFALSSTHRDDSFSSPLALFY